MNSLRTIALYDLAASSRVPPANAASQIGAADVASSELSSGSAQAGGRNAPPNGSALVPQLPQAPEPTSTDGDGADGASAEAWAHGSHWGRSPLQPEHADELRKASANLQSMVAGLKLSTAEVTSASLAVAYSLYALTDYDKALTAYSSFDWASDPTVGVVNGDAAVVERVRARATQGMCFELCSRPDASLALQCYLEAVKLMDKFAVSPMPTPAYLLPANAPRPSLPSADSQRELMRYISTSLTRATAIVAHTADSHLTLRILRTYHTLAASWSPSFRPRQRQRMLNVYLAALFESFPSAGATVPEPLLLSGGVANRTGRATWRAEVVEAFRYGQRMLGDTTRFPKAGKLNVPVVQFADQVSMFPDHTPSLTRDAITILWWSTNLTFQSQLILRRLTCLLATTNDTLEARRVFELYVDTVLKARLTENPDSTLALQRQKSIDDSELTDNPNDEQLVDANGHGEKDPVVRYGEMDGDTDFVSTLLVGTRLLLTDLKDAKEAWRYATLAGDIGKSGQLSRKVMALVEENKGVVRQVMSTTGKLTTFLALADSRSGQGPSAKVPSAGDQSPAPCDSTRPALLQSVLPPCIRRSVRALDPAGITSCARVVGARLAQRALLAPPRAVVNSLGRLGGGAQGVRGWRIAVGDGRRGARVRGGGFANRERERQLWNAPTTTNPLA